MLRFLSLLFALSFLSAGSVSAETLTNYFIVKVKLDNKAVEASKVRDYARRVLGEEFELSRFSETYQRVRDDVLIKSEIPIIKALSVVGSVDQINRSSSLFYRNQKLLLSQSTERVGTKGDLHVAVVDYRRKRVQFMKNRQLVSEERIDGDLIDLASLPYYWIGRKVDARDLRIDVTDAKKIYRSEVFSASDLTVNFLGERQSVVRFVRQRKDPKTPPLELWVRKTDGIPIRVMTSLSPKHGVSLDIYPYKKPDRL